jgi:hypothetical protein
MFWRAARAVLLGLLLFWCSTPEQAITGLAARAAESALANYGVYYGYLQRERKCKSLPERNHFTYLAMMSILRNNLLRIYSTKLIEYTEKQGERVVRSQFPTCSESLKKQLEKIFQKLNSKWRL